MATLESVSGASFVPNLTAAFDRGQAGFEKQAAKRKQAEFEEAVQLETRILGGEGGDFSAQEKKDSLTRLAILNPELAKAVAQVQKSGDELAAAQLARLANKEAKDATFVLKQKTPEGRLNAVKENIRRDIANNLDVSEKMKTLDLENDDELKLKMLRNQIGGQTIEKILAPVKPVVVPKDASLVDPVTKEVLFDSPVTDEGVDFAKPALKDFTKKSRDKASRPGGSISDLVMSPEALAKLGGSDAFKIGREVKIRIGDKEYFVTPVTQRDATGKVVTVGNITPIVGPDKDQKVDFISPLGETGGQLTSRKIQEAGGKTGAELEAEAEGRPAVIEAETRTEGTETRIQKSIQDGIDAAVSIAPLKRSLELVKIVGTGRPKEAILSFQNIFGFAPADETELQSALQIEVLKQIRPTFGAQPSKEEGLILLDLNTNFGKSTEGNIRLLNRTIALVNERVGVGLEDAKSVGDQNAIDRINRAMQFEIKPEAQANQPGQIGRFKVRVK